MIFLFTWVIFQFHVHLQGCTPPKTNMTMENPLFEDVFPIENKDFPMSCSFSGVYPLFLWTCLDLGWIATSAGSNATRKRLKAIQPDQVPYTGTVSWTQNITPPKTNMSPKKELFQ